MVFEDFHVFREEKFTTAASSAGFIRDITRVAQRENLTTMRTALRYTAGTSKSGRLPRVTTFVVHFQSSVLIVFAFREESETCEKNPMNVFCVATPRLSVTKSSLCNSRFAHWTALPKSYGQYSSVTGIWLSFPCLRQVTAAWRTFSCFWFCILHGFWPRCHATSLLTNVGDRGGFDRSALRSGCR